MSDAAGLGMGSVTASPERLAAFSRVATADVDQAAEQIGRIFCPHDLKPLRAASTGFYARHNCASYDGISINYVAYGGSVTLGASPLGGLRVTLILPRSEG